jgi:hypothetical protein
MTIVGYRTLIISSVVTVLGALQGLDWVNLIPNDPQAAGWVMTAIGVLMASLRVITTGPVGGASK